MSEPRQQGQELGRRVDDDVGRLHELARGLVRRDGDPNPELEVVECAEGVDVGRVVAGVERSTQARVSEQLRDRGPLVGVHGRAELEHLAPETRHEAGCTGALGDTLEVLERLVFVLGLAVVERDRQALVLDGPVHARREAVDLVAPAVGLGRELEPVRSDVAHAGDADEPPRVLSCAATDAGDERVPRDQALELAARRLGNRGLVRSAHDRRERPVDVEHDRRTIGGLGEGVESRHGSYDTAVRLIAIGLVAGFFSALFGVGGGIVVVPLLILLVGFEERPAMATSLASIGLIAAVGTISYAVRGDVHVGYGLLLGLPAAAGAIAGTALQQRIAGPMLSYGFAALLAVVGIWLLV